MLMTLEKLNSLATAEPTSLESLATEDRVCAARNTTILPLRTSIRVLMTANHLLLKSVNVHFAPGKIAITNYWVNF